MSLKPKPKSSLSNPPGNPVIAGILDIVVDIKGWSPESIQPDDRLGVELEMSEVEIAAVAAFLHDRFRLSSHLKLTRDLTLRQLASEIQSRILSAA